MTLLFDDVQKWKRGVDHEAVALQAVMPNVLGSDTIHLACSIPIRKKLGGGDVVLKQQKAVAEKKFALEMVDHRRVGCDLLT